jgi:hypothetical protein
MHGKIVIHINKQSLCLYGYCQAKAKYPEKKRGEGGGGVITVIIKAVSMISYITH